LALDPANVDALVWTVRIDALIPVSDMTDDCAERSLAPQSARTSKATMCPPARHLDQRTERNLARP